MQRSNSASFTYNGRPRSMTPSILAAMSAAAPQPHPIPTISVNNTTRQKLQAKKASELALLDSPDLYKYYYDKYSL